MQHYPNPTVAVPVVESMRYTAHDPTLRELYSSLLASAMNSDTADNAHPAFVEMIRQMTPEEAKILKFIVERRGLYSFRVITYLIGSETVVFEENAYRNIAAAAGAKEERSPSSVENLERLKLIKTTGELNPVFIKFGPSREMLPAPPGMQELYVRGGLDAIKECQRVLEAARTAPVRHSLTQMTIFPVQVEPTSLGRQFYRACGQA